MSTTPRPTSSASSTPSTPTGARRQPALTSHDQNVLQPKHRQAEHFTAAQGIEIANHGPAEGGKTVGFIDNGDWISFTPYAVGNARTFTARVSSAGAGGTLEVRAGSHRHPAGHRHRPGHRSWETFRDVTTSLSGAPSGSTTLYLVFKGVTGAGNLFDVDAFTFTTG